MGRHTGGLITQRQPDSAAGKEEELRVLEARAEGPGCGHDPGSMGQMRRFLAFRDGAQCVSRVCARRGAQMLLRLSHLRISVCVTDALRPHLPASAAPGPLPRPTAISELLARVRGCPRGLSREGRLPGAGVILRLSPRGNVL